jgi:hypothetical protein
VGGVETGNPEALAVALDGRGLVEQDEQAGNAIASKNSSPASRLTRRIATRYEKLHATFAAVTSLACILI